MFAAFGILDYLKIGLAVIAAAVIGWFVWKWSDMKSELATAQAQVVAAQATINELQSVNTQNRQAIADLQADNGRAETAIASANSAQQGTVQTVEKWRTKYVQVPAETCDGVVTARDRATVDGVRDVLSPDSAAGHPDRSGQGAAAGKPAG